MGPHDARLVPSALAAYAVAGAFVAGWPLVAISLTGLLVLGTVALRGRRAATSLGLAAAIALVVTVVTAVHLDSRWRGDLDTALGGGPVLVSATAIREPEPVRTPALNGEPRVRVALGLDAWAPRCGCADPALDAAWRPARATITVIAESPWDELEYGDRVLALVDLQPARAGRDVAVAWRAEIVNSRSGSHSDRAIAHLRQGLRAATEHLPVEVRGLTRGMVIGDTSEMPAEQIDSMRVTSLAHLTAVSGAHFAIVLMATAGAMRVWRWPRRIRAVLAAIVMAGLATLVFPEPSVLRALAMSAAVCAALWWGRPAQALPALAGGIVALLVIDPFLALSFGFALSVTAVAAIVVWAPVLAARLQRWVTPAFATLISIPIAAQVACAPILVLLNPGVGVYGVAANMVAVVFAVPVTLLGMLAVVIAAAHVPTATVVATVAGSAAWPIAWVSSVLADAPGSWLSWPGGVSGAAAMAIASTTIIFATSTRGVPGWWRAAVAIGVVSLLVAMPAVRQAVGLSARTVEDWSVVVCDVGQGHMMMLRAAHDAAVVIDVGAPGHGGAECLRRHGIAHVPLLILTHPHTDHDGAVAEVASEVSVGAAWVSPAGTTAPHDRAYVDLQAHGVPVTVAQAGDNVSVGAVTLTVWHPSPLASTSNVNDASIVVSGHASGVSVVNLGDIEETAQRSLLSTVSKGMAVDVLLVAHHGSANQHPAFVEALEARIAAVGVGADNRHGHPTASALELYGARGALVLPTDECGDLVIARREQLALSVGCPELVAG